MQIRQHEVKGHHLATGVSSVWAPQPYPDSTALSILDSGSMFPSQYPRNLFQSQSVASSLLSRTKVAATANAALLVLSHETWLGLELLLS